MQNKAKFISIFTKVKLAKRSLAVLIAIVLLVQTVPMSMAYPAGTMPVNVSHGLETTPPLTAEVAAAAAAGPAHIEPNTIEEEPVAIIAEIESLREENVRHFRNADGSFSAVLYSEPVHFQDEDGVWQEIDNTLQFEPARRGEPAFYGVTASDMDIRVPQSFADGQQLSVTRDGFTVGLGVSETNEDVQLEQRVSVIDVDELPSENMSVASQKPLAVIARLDEPMTMQQQVEERNAEIMEVENLTSAVVYEDIFPDADLEYVITPSAIKGNVVVHEPQEEYVYHFTLSYDGLMPMQQESGAIYLFADANDNEPLFIVKAPVMFDAAGEVSTALELVLEDGILTLTADANWLNAEERVFPVAIDPTLVISRQTGIHDAMASSLMSFQTFRNQQNNIVGRSPARLDTRRTYIRFDLPNLPDNSVVAHAALVLFMRADSWPVFENQMVVFDATGRSTWNPNTLTWNNQPFSTNLNGVNNELALDYVDMQSSQVRWDANRPQPYHWDITRAAKNWYEGTGINNGLMLAMRDEARNGYVSILSSSPLNSSGQRPMLVISYINNTGLEPHWDYETVSLCRFGTAFTNVYSGELTYAVNLIGLGGNMPMNITHIYNLSTENRNTLPAAMRLGSFSMNLMERILPIPANSDLHNRGYRFRHIDADGTAHYFRLPRANANYSVHEHNSDLRLRTSGTLRIMEDGHGNIKTFQMVSNVGRLISVADRYGTKHITWANNRITQVTDGAGRVAMFTYNASGFLTGITDPAGRTTTFQYSGNLSNSQLLEIHYPNGNHTRFAYHANGNLSQIITYDGVGTTTTRINYHQVQRFGRPFYRVSQIEYFARGETTATRTMGFTYHQGMTRVTERVGSGRELWREYVFDNAGRTVNVRNQDGQSAFALHYSDGDRANQPSMTSTTQTFGENLLHNHGFETAEGWNIEMTGAGAGAVSFSNNRSARGAVSLEHVHTLPNHKLETMQDITLVPGETYTVSVDALAVANFEATAGGAFVGVYFLQNGVWVLNRSAFFTPPTDDWERYSHTFIVPKDVTQGRVVMGTTGATGAMHFDNAQLEMSAGASPYNLMSNSNFANGLTNWIMSNTEASDGIHVQNGRNVVAMTGDPTRQKRVTQRVPLNAQEGETVIFGGVGWSTGVGTHGDERRFSVVAEFYTAAGLRIGEAVEAPFHRDVHGHQQITASAFTLPQHAAFMDFSFVFENQLNQVRFYDAFVHVGDFATNYSYNESGLLTRIVNDAGREMIVEYNNNRDITSITERQDGQERNSITVNYDEHRRVTSTVDNNGVTTSFTYAGPRSHIVTGITTTSADGTLVSSEQMTYTPDYNFIATFTNARGGVSSFTYDLQRGLRLSATDPTGNTVTYTYDPLSDELLSVAGRADPNIPVSTSFTHQGYMLQNITRNSMQYGHVYDNFNRVTQSKVGNQTLVMNTYDAQHRLTRQTFANGAVYEPIYDNRDRMIGERWDGVQTSSFFLNDNNRLSRTMDYITGVSRQYNYDLSNRITSVVGSDGTTTRIGYDSRNVPNRLTFGQNHATIFDATYRSDDQGRVYHSTLHTLGNATLRYQFDGLSRMHSRSFQVAPGDDGVEFATSLSFAPGQNGNTTGLISEFAIDRNILDSSNSMFNWRYTHDDNGNITSIAETVAGNATNFTYDGLNRLTSETINGVTYRYYYDIGGNITSITREGVPLHTFAYNDANWRDLLTSFDGNEITYDAMGNPLTYNGYTFTWERGRLLTRIYGNGQDIRFTYDAAGRRTSRTVNGVTTRFYYAGNLLMRQCDGIDTLDFAYDASGRAIGFNHNGTPYFYLHNLLGDVVAISDAQGNIVAEYVYDAWGNVLSATGPMADINPIRYRGKYYDAVTGWYWLETRYYNPQWRRFINADVLFIAGCYLTAANMFAYCNNNPVMFVDPDGMAGIPAEIGRTGLNVFNFVSFIVDSVVSIAQTLRVYNSQQFNDTWSISTISYAANAFFGTFSFEFGILNVFVDFVAGTPQGILNFAAGLMADSFGNERRPWSALGLAAAGFIPGVGVALGFRDLFVAMDQISNPTRNLGRHLFDSVVGFVNAGEGESIWAFIPVRIQVGANRRWPSWLWEYRHFLI